MKPVKNHWDVLGLSYSITLAIAGSITTGIISPLMGKFFAAVPLWRKHQ